MKYMSDVLWTALPELAGLLQLANGLSLHLLVRLQFDYLP